MQNPEVTSAVGVSNQTIHLPIVQILEIGRNEGDVNDGIEQFEDDEKEYEYGPDREDKEYEHQEFVMRKLLLTPKQSDKSQHHKLLQIKCTISGNIFYSVIDNDSN